MFVKRLLREPLVHFLLLGLVLFAAYEYSPVSREQSPREANSQSARPISYDIALSLDQLSQLARLFQAQWGREPTEAEFGRLIENSVQEEVLYREALVIGLDKDDEIVRRRMAQKMQFLAEDVAAAHEPTVPELKEWFTQHADKFMLPNRVSFRHLYFSPDSRGARARDDAANVLTKLKGQPEETELAKGLADPFMFQDYYRDRASDNLAKEFGPPFAQAISNLIPGSWQGPVESGLGWHLVFVDTQTHGRVPAFEEIEPDVKTAWLAAQKEAAWKKAYTEMRAKYKVLVSIPPSSAVDPLVAHGGPKTPLAAPSAARAR